MIVALPGLFFYLFLLVCFLFGLVSWIVIVALPGLFSYLFYYIYNGMSLHVCPCESFVLDSRLANVL